MVTYAVVGGGILGVAVARQLLVTDADARVTLFEKETSLARHQTGRNSGVVHAGLYYEPGSLKALLCRRGVDLLRTFCERHDVEYRTCGKVLVALDEQDRQRMLAIAGRARQNGVPGIRVLNATELRNLEPNVAGIAGLHSPTTAIVDFAEVTRRLAADAEARGAVLSMGREVTDLANSRGRVIVNAGGEQSAFDRVIVCAGLQADRVAVKAGEDADPSIVPFRGEYFRLRADRRHLVRGLVYPVPDPRYPFLGVHVTPRIDGEVLIGPNAVLALSREGYASNHDFSRRDAWEIIHNAGFWRFARQHWAAGLTEMRGSMSKAAFITAARRYVPDLTVDDVVAGPTGIRAQALSRRGALVDDFKINRRQGLVFIRNAPSPAATSALAIAEHVIAVAAADSATV